MKSTKPHKASLALLYLLLATPLLANHSESAPAPEDGESIRHAYEKRQKELARAARHMEEDRRTRGMQQPGKRQAPLIVKAVSFGFGLIVFASICDRRRWLPEVFGVKFCKRLGYVPPAGDKRRWPKITPVTKYPTPIPEKLSAWHTSFEDEDDDRIVVDMDKVSAYAVKSDLGFDPRIGGKLTVARGGAE